MTRRVYWGVAILIILLGIASVFIIQHEHVKDSELDVQLKEAEDLANQIKQQQESKGRAPATEVENAANRLSDDNQQANGNLPNGQKVDTFPDWGSLTREQQKHIYDQFYVQFGLEVPPKGYDYHWKEPGVPHLDENGKPILRRLDEPYVEVEMGIGFAPTRQELEQYNKIYDDMGWATARGDLAEANRLEAELDALVESVQRMRPISVTAYGSTAEANAKSDQFSKEKFNAALREHGLEHLIKDD